MTDAQDRELSLEKLTRMVQPDTEPMIKEYELEEILDRHARAYRWSAAKVYVYGELVMPTVRNGHIYRVTTAGTGSSTQPTWPTSEASSITDGAASLEESGPDTESIYDLRGAAEECCAIKVRKSAHFIDAGDLSFSQVHQHWLAQMRGLASVRIA